MKCEICKEDCLSVYRIRYKKSGIYRWSCSNCMRILDGLWEHAGGGTHIPKTQEEVATEKEKLEIIELAEGVIKGGVV